jgi:hypothetical protein
MNVRGVDFQGIAILVAVGAGIYFLYKGGTAVANFVSDTAGKVADAVNPTSDQNLAYKGVNAIGASMSGDAGFSLGSWTYDLLHPNDGNILSGGTLPQQAVKTMQTAPKPKTIEVLPVVKDGTLTQGVYRDLIH